MNFAKGFKKFSDSIDKICTIIVVIMLAAMVVVTMAQIICRTWFTALQWSEEVNRYLLVWSTFLGASCVYKAGTHISITFVQGFFSPKVQRAIRIFVHVLCLLSFCAVVYFGLLYTLKQAQLAPALRIPLKYMYMSIPIGFSLMSVHAIDAILDLLQEKGGKLQ